MNDEFNKLLENTTPPQLIRATMGYILACDNNAPMNAESVYDKIIDYFDLPLHAKRIIIDWVKPYFLNPDKFEHSGEGQSPKKSDQIWLKSNIFDDLINFCKGNLTVENVIGFFDSIKKDRKISEEQRENYRLLIDYIKSDGRLGYPNLKKLNLPVKVKELHEIIKSNSYSLDVLIQAIIIRLLVNNKIARNGFIDILIAELGIFNKAKNDIVNKGEKDLFNKVLKLIEDIMKHFGSNQVLIITLDGKCALGKDMAQQIDSRPPFVEDEEYCNFVKNNRANIGIKSELNYDILKFHGLLRSSDDVLIQRIDKKPDLKQEAQYNEVNKMELYDILETAKNKEDGLILIALLKAQELANKITGGSILRLINAINILHSRNMI